MSNFTDIASNNGFAQSTVTNRPAYQLQGIGSSPSLLFDGTNDALVKTGDVIGAGDVTISTVINARGWGGGGLGKIIANNKFYLDISHSTDSVRVISDGSQIAASATSSIVLSTSYVISITRTSAGVTNFYINGALSSTADQSSGTPIAGSDTYIGNRSTGTMAFDGSIGTIVVFPSILDSSSRNQIEKTMADKYGVSIADDSAGTADSSIYPQIALNQPLGYSTISSFSPVLDGASSGTIRYQLSNDTTSGNNDSANWYYFNTSNSTWTQTDGNNAYKSNTADEINSNVTSFSSINQAGTRNTLKWKAFFITDGIDNPILQSVSSVYIADTVAPDNPTQATATVDGTTIASGAWSKYASVAFHIPTGEEAGAAVDRAGANEVISGVDGYYLYFGESNSADPLTTSGLIETNSSPHYQTTADLNLQNLSLESGKTYYLLARTKDKANNLATGSVVYTYNYDATLPPSPEYINVSPLGCSTSSAYTFTWPAVTDVGGSQLDHYIYKIGMNGEEKQISSSQNSVSDIKPYQDGENVFYIKAVDAAGNQSANWQTGIFCATGVVSIIDGPKVEAGPSSMKVSWTTSKKTRGTVRVYDGNEYITEQANGSYSLVHSVEVVGLKSEKAYRYQLTWADESGNVGESDWYETNTAETPRVIDLEADIANPTKAIVSWKTNYMAESTLKYGVGGYDKESKIEGQATAFSTQIENLQAGSSYSVGVNAISQDGAEFSGGITFQTPPLPAISGLRFETITVDAAPSAKVTWVTNIDTTSTVFYGPKGEAKKEVSVSDKAKEHEITINGLLDNTVYEIYAAGSDQYGNQVKSDVNTFATPFDTRPPKISDIVIETSNVGLDRQDKAQVVVSWKTDEPATSQVEYSPGISGSDYSNRTVKDTSLTNSHIVVIGDLTPGTPYYLRVVSSDGAGNETFSKDSSIVTGNVSRSILQIIVNTLSGIFGWMAK